MSASSYDEALARLLVHEGGYSNHPADPGGPTNFGITLADARAYWKRDATAADVRAMPLAVAKTIYRTRYWAALCCDDLPAGVDYAVFDYGVNSGIGRAAKVLQRLVDAICDERLAFLQGLATWPVFGNGWGRRVREVRAAAREMAARATTPAPAPVPAKPPPAAAPPPRGRLSALIATLVSFLTHRKGD